jgi:alkylresorcinol/alkylpyrone synthase
MRFSQKECWSAAQTNPRFCALAPRSQALVKKVLLGNNGISFRHIAVNSIDEMFDVSPDALHARFITHAPALAEKAARHALTASGTAIDQVDALIISTCTGYLCPGLTSYLGEALGLRHDIIGLDLVGHGCGAALPNLNVAESLLKADKARFVLSVCVEVCSAAFYLDDDPGVLISACLFGDAAGALVLSKEPSSAARRIEWKTGWSIMDPKARDLLRFEQRGGMLRNILTREVPAFAATKAEQVLRHVLQSAGVHKKEIATWIVHAGGRDVLAAVGERFSLEPVSLAWSAEVLNDLGNVSSPCVIHVLERAMAGGAPPGYWWMTSFGAGFSCHGALIEVH